VFDVLFKVKPNSIDINKAVAQPINLWESHKGTGFNETLTYNLWSELFLTYLIRGYTFLHPRQKKRSQERTKDSLIITPTAPRYIQK